VTAHRRETLERKLGLARESVRKAELRLADTKRHRDALVVELRSLEDRPSARAVGEIAGISDAWVLRLERDAAP